MSDDDSRRTVQDHYDALHLMKEGLEDANALKVFLMALAKAIQELDGEDADTSQQTLFLTTLDEWLDKLHPKLRSGPKIVLTTKTFRHVLDQQLDEMRMYQNPPQ